MKVRRDLFTLSLLVLASTAVEGSTLPDATLFTSYTLESGGTLVRWVVCGSVQDVGGCFADGTLGPFGKVGALLEGDPGIIPTTNIVARAIYVLDVQGGPSGNGVTLNIYVKADVVSSTSDTATVTLFKQVDLPLVGGSQALASMAANSMFIYIGTNQSPDVVQFHKGIMAIASFGPFSTANQCLGDYHQREWLRRRDLWSVRRTIQRHLGVQPTRCSTGR